MAQSRAVLSSAAQAPHSNGRAWPPQRRALSCFVIRFCDLFAEGRELRSIKPQSVDQWTIAVGTPLVPTPQLPSDFSPSGCGRPWDSFGRWCGRVSPGAGAAPGAGCSLDCGAGDSQRGGHLLSPTLQVRSFGRVWGLSLLVCPLPCPPPQQRIRFRVPVCVSAFREPKLRHWVR